ncbi:DNA repair and recombination protein RAD54-like isoform X2 [Schistocerca gregaria]|nr:DNA repair and recombination protein RAD54-like isoform X2 [Schistocerca gregaria]
MEGKQIGSLEIERSPHVTEYEEFEEGDDEKQSVLRRVHKRDRELYIYPGNSIVISTQVVQICFRVSLDEFKTGAFFLRTPEELRKRSTSVKKNGYISMSTKRPTGWIPPWKTNAPTARREKLTEPLFNPNDPSAVVLYRPCDPLKKEVAVVVDPVIGKCLRPHQVQGIQFLYDCVMGHRGYKGEGCILADDMGLGKTIQAIGLVWTLLHQSPSGVPAVKKAVIVAPSSLVGNWCKEFKKWLGAENVDPVPLGDSDKKKAKSSIATFKFSHEVRQSILVASYDQLKIYIKEISAIKDIGLVICDEGHRLKNSQSKTSIAVNMLPATKRVILSGTPIQNDLEEFHAMVSFCNPGILRDVGVFRTVYSEKILAMREPEATAEERAIGRERALNLSKLTSEFILRRTANVNRKYLPPKVDHLVICKLKPLQEAIYKHICEAINRDELASLSKDGKTSAASGGGCTALANISDLKKVCNDPNLVRETYGHLFPPDFGNDSTKFAVKLKFIETLLTDLRNNGRDRIVIVSNYTQTLSVLANMCASHNWGYFQLDGSTVVAKRQKLVDMFNDPLREEFIFLLSSKAGGCGLNLVGANHLVLFDPDWNPANDLQAMARVWRPGQTKKVYLYRTLCTGTIEEKIFQRQVAKLSLADSVVTGDADSVPDFNTKDLMDIFTYRGQETNSDTHDLLNCRCSKDAKKIPLHKRQAAKVDELRNWVHYDDVSRIKEHSLLKSCQGEISFVFLKETDPSKATDMDDLEQEVSEVAVNFASVEEEQITA